MGLHYKNEQIAPLFWSLVTQFKAEGGNLVFLKTILEMVENPACIARLWVLSEASKPMTQQEIEAQTHTGNFMNEMKVFHNLHYLHQFLNKQDQRWYYTITPLGKKFCQEFLEENRAYQKEISYLERILRLCEEFGELTGESVQVQWKGQLVHHASIPTLIDGYFSAKSKNHVRKNHEETL